MILVHFIHGFIDPRSYIRQFLNVECYDGKYLIGKDFIELTTTWLKMFHCFNVSLSEQNNEPLSCSPNGDSKHRYVIPSACDEKTQDYVRWRGFSHRVSCVWSWYLVGFWYRHFWCSFLWFMISVFILCIEHVQHFLMPMHHFSWSGVLGGFHWYWFIHCRCLDNFIYNIFIYD